MDFIGRTSELATLNAELERGSGFVVIYGRRRVGKTTLIKEFIKDNARSTFWQPQKVKPEHEAVCRGAFPYHEESHAQQGHIHRLAGFIPSGSRRPPGREKGACH